MLQEAAAWRTDKRGLGLGLGLRGGKLVDKPLQHPRAEGCGLDWGHSTGDGDKRCTGAVAWR